MRRNILCIDLKSFFAAVECVERKLDPFTTPLVVTDIKRGNGAITLAVTPYLKNLGVASRGRVYELPKNINIIYARPRMSLYLKKSEEVISIYMNYVSHEDIHIYSIDEVFLDVTDYLKLYKKTDYELALEIMKDIKEKTGLYSTCGIGPNMFLAKVALDIEAKNNKDFIAKWDYNDIKTKLWNIKPLSKLWGIGNSLEKKLNNMGIYSVGDINKYDIYFYKKRFGIIGEELWNHANGIDEAYIKDYNITPINRSYGSSQILFRDYHKNEVYLIIKEMISLLTKRLRENNNICESIYFSISYSKTIGGGFSHSKKLDNRCDDEKIIYEVCKNIYEKYIEDKPIRKVSISLGHIQKKEYEQLNLFNDFNEKVKNDKLLTTIDNINNKYNNNTILKASSLLNNSTIKDRNKKLGGHYG